MFVVVNATIGYSRGFEVGTSRNSWGSDRWVTSDVWVSLTAAASRPASRQHWRRPTLKRLRFSHRSIHSSENFSVTISKRVCVEQVESTCVFLPHRQLTYTPWDDTTSTTTSTSPLSSSFPTTSCVAPHKWSKFEALRYYQVIISNLKDVNIRKLGIGKGSVTHRTF